jgi:hypothetical protein
MITLGVSESEKFKVKRNTLPNPERPKGKRQNLQICSVGASPLSHHCSSRPSQVISEMRHSDLEIDMARGESPA